MKNASNASLYRCTHFSLCVSLVQLPPKRIHVWGPLPILIQIIAVGNVSSQIIECISRLENFVQVVHCLCSEVCVDLYLLETHGQLAQGNPLETSSADRSRGSQTWQVCSGEPKASQKDEDQYRNSILCHIETLGMAFVVVYGPG